MIEKLIDNVYTDESDQQFLIQKITERIEAYKRKIHQPRKKNWNQEDIFLITYGDQFTKGKDSKLATFREFYLNYLAEMFPIVHFLPFFPYTSDDGFSVVDYEEVNPEIGDWADIQLMNQDARLMFDFVCNHMSSKSEWVCGYLADKPEFEDFFIDMNPELDLSGVIRPRTTPLLTKFITEDGLERNLWTTFSDDQLDLNFENPKVLLRMIDTLLFYLDQGAHFVRLDAIGFLWKKIDTSCIHLPETHSIVQLFRAIVDEVAPGTILITETNVPHKDNVSYFGDGQNEAQMVYQFPLPPLVVYSIKTGDTQYLKKWAAEITLPSENTTFFNFLASHDGIGLNPIRGIVPEENILEMVARLQNEGALVNYKKNPDGTASPYEINTTYMDALSRKKDSDELCLQRFLLAHSVLLTLVGIPAIYIQSVLGSRNYEEGVKMTGANRTINREKYNYHEIVNQLELKDSLRSMTYQQLKVMVKRRKEIAQLHPNSKMEILKSNNQIFAYVREHSFYAIHNMNDAPTSIILPSGFYQDVLQEKKIELTNELILAPYEFRWLEKIEK